MPDTHEEGGTNSLQKKSPDGRMQETGSVNSLEKKSLDSRSSIGDEGPVELKREVGLLGAFSYVVGSMIGSGIFVSPKGVLAATLSVGMSLVVWFICGIVAIVAYMYVHDLMGEVTRRSLT